MKKYTFPKNFMLGGAAAACQYEGAYDQDGKTLTVEDWKYYSKNLDRKKMNANDLDFTEESLQQVIKEENDKTFPFRWAIDFYNNYEEDLEYFEKVGIKCFRTSISWARIFPKSDGVVNQVAVEHYKKIFACAKKRNIQMVITLSHYDHPMWLLEEYNGFLDKRSIHKFKEYAKLCFEEFGQFTNYWIGFNEINIGSFSSYTGLGFVIKENDPKREEKIMNALHNQFVAQAEITKLAHEISKELKVGCMIASLYNYPLNCKPENVELTQKTTQKIMYFHFDVVSKGVYPEYMLKHFERNNIVLNTTPEELDVIKNNTVDYLTFSYYQTGVMSEANNGKNVFMGREKNPYLEETEWGWHIDPKGLRTLMNELYFNYRKPLMIVENGIGVDEKWDESKNALNDTYRIDYMREHLKQVLLAIHEDGVNCIGYTCWTAIDLISMGTKEMSKRYGLIYVDQDDFGNGSKKRKIKDSGKWFKEISDSNGEKLW